MQLHLNGARSFRSSTVGSTAGFIFLGVPDLEPQCVLLGAELFGLPNISKSVARKGCEADTFELFSVFRWFKFTLKPPYSMAHGNFFLAIWDTSHWNFFVKFGLKTPYDIS